MERPSLEMVLQAVDAMYRGEKPDSEKASQWLTELHSSVYAWEIADQLLLLKRDEKTSYFAAQTMKNKIRFSFDELPSETHIALRDSLMNHLQNLSDAPISVTRQLAMALADLALQISGWTTVVNDLMQRFIGDHTTISVLLDVLTLLPEEIDNRSSLHLGQTRRQELSDILGQNVKAVLCFLAECFSSCNGDAEVITRIYACMGSWVQLGSFPGEELAQSFLVPAPFRTLKLLEIPPKLYEAASDCICSILFMCEQSPITCTLNAVMQAQVQDLLPVFQAAIMSEDMTRAKSLCRIFTEMAESFLYHMVHQPGIGPGGLQTLDLLLECSLHPDYEIVDVTFNVWYRLCEELHKLNDAALTDTFKPYLQRLISSLCMHCRLDEDTDSVSVISDDNDDFSTFRSNVVELVRDVVLIVDALSCFVDLYANICKPGTPWNVTEACLFLMYAVAPSISVAESEALPIAVPVLLSIAPDSHYAIRVTTLRLVGELADWIDQHPDNLELVLSFLMDGLHIPAMASYAASAVQKVCLRCKRKMAPHIDGLLQIIHAADNLGISNEATLGLLKGVTDVVTKMDCELMKSCVHSLCCFHIVYLQQLCERAEDAGPNGSNGDPCVWLDRLSAIFRAVALDLKDEEEHPCSLVVQEIWPVISACCYKFKHNIRIVERTCRCIRFMVRAVVKGAAPVLSPLVTMCVELYLGYQHSCYLYLGSVIVDEFGSDAVYQPGLVQFLQSLAEIAFPVLASANGLVNNPDTVDDMFRLCSRFVQRCPLAYFSSPVFPIATQCALAAATLNHRDAFSSVMKYLRDLLHTPNNSADTNESDHQLKMQVVQTFLDQNCVVLIDALVTGFANLPTVMISDSSEVLWELISVAREAVCLVLSSRVEHVSRGKIKTTAVQKSNFVSSVSKTNSIDELRPVIKSFARLFR